MVCAIIIFCVYVFVELNNINVIVYAQHCPTNRRERTKDALAALNID